MTPTRDLWEVRLSAAAASDYSDIARWTLEQFGTEQARTYAELLDGALVELHAGPNIPGARRRMDLPEGFFALHASRGRRKARHFIVFRYNRDADEEYIEVVRILHDSMDLQRHLGLDDEK